MPRRLVDFPGAQVGVYLDPRQEIAVGRHGARDAGAPAAAFAGLERMRAAYTHAIARSYRFYSYGDACLLERVDATG